MQVISKNTYGRILLGLLTKKPSKSPGLVGLRKFAFLCNCKKTLSVLEYSVEILVGQKKSVKILVGIKIVGLKFSRPKF